ncbi:MAG: Multimodular transpeptidase-transglycosylase, partial [uncultured Thermoleophilia bacterium]
GRRAARPHGGDRRGRRRHAARGGRLHADTAPARGLPPLRAERELGRVRPRRHPARGDRQRPQPHRRAAPEDLALPARRHRGDRGPALLRAPRRRLRGHRPRGLEGHQRGRDPRGRLDADDAADLAALHHEGAHLRPQDQGGLARDPAREGDAEGEDPRAVPEHDLLRTERVRRRGRRPGLLQPDGEERDAPAGGADRGPGPAPLRLRPVVAPGARAPPPERGARRDALHPEDHGRPVAAGTVGPPAAEAEPAGLRPRPRAVRRLLRDEPARQGQEVRRGQGAGGRPLGPHHHRPRAPAPGRARHARRAPQPRGPGRRGRHDRPEDGRHPGPGLDAALRQGPVQPRHAGQAAAGLDVQADDARGGDRDGHQSAVHPLRLQAVHLRLPGRRGRRLPVRRVGREHRRRVARGRPGDALQRHAGLGQHGLRAARHRRGRRQDQEHGRAARHPVEARRGRLADAGRGGRHPARADERLRHAGRERRLPAAADHDPDQPRSEDGARQVQHQGLPDARSRRRLRGQSHPLGQRHDGYRHAGADVRRAPAGRQDGHHGPLGRRLVLRVHARARH